MNTREILFRGKRVDNGEWIKGDLITTPFIRNETQQNIIYILDITKADYDCFDDLTEYNGIFEVVLETVGQYTGYKDDTGRSIFEGDIVAFDDMISTESGYSEMSCCGKVGYDKEEACFYVTNRLSVESWEVLGGCHVIGNIFDKPNLLAEEESEE